MLALISVVKDEIDVIQHMIEYHRNLGVEAFFIKDNESIDGTYEYLLSQKSDRFFVYKDTETNHYQSKKMTDLANIAYNHGYRFILPLDADELLVTKHTVRELCEAMTEQGLIKLDWKFYHNTEIDDLTEPNPFKRLTHTSGTQRNLRKSLIRWKPGMRIWQGNHGIDNPGGYFAEMKATDTFVANFPWRSKEQALKKIIANGVSHKNIRDNADEINANYRGWLSGGQEWLDNFWEERIVKASELERMPIL